MHTVVHLCCHSCLFCWCFLFLSSLFQTRRFIGDLLKVFLIGTECYVVKFSDVKYFVSFKHLVLLKVLTKLVILQSLFDKLLLLQFFCKAKVKEVKKIVSGHCLCKLTWCTLFVCNNDFLDHSPVFCTFKERRRDRKLSIIY